jgi:hypothetical protein
MRPKKSVKKVWVLVRLDAAKVYVDPEMRYVKYSGNEDFAMFSHVNTNDVLEAIHFGSYREAAAYLDQHRNGIFGPDTTFPREATITTVVS